MCATVMTDTEKKKIYYMLICMVKGRPSLVNFIPYAKPPATQSSITWQKVYTIFERAIFIQHLSQRCFLYCPCWPCCWHIQKRAIRFYAFFFGLPLTWYTSTYTYSRHMTQTHFYSAICFRLPWHTLIHSFSTSLEDTRAYTPTHTHILHSDTPCLV